MFQGLPPQDSRNQEREYASSDFDIRHRLTVTAGYAIPGKKGFGQLLEGWKLNSIVTLEGSQPWLVFDNSGGQDFSTGGSGFGDLTDRWDFFGNPTDFRSSSSSLPFCNGLGGPGTGTGCYTVSGITGIVTCAPGSDNTVNGNPCSSFSSALPTASTMFGKCTAVAPDPTTLGSAAAM